MSYIRDFTVPGFLAFMTWFDITWYRIKHCYEWGRKSTLQKILSIWDELDIFKRGRGGVTTVRYFLRWGFYFSILQKYLLVSAKHFNVWQVSPQLSWGDTCHIWTWYSMVTSILTMVKGPENNGTEETGLVTPTPAVCQPEHMRTRLDCKWYWTHTPSRRRHTRETFPHYWPFVRKTTGDRWIPSYMASIAELWCFLCC